MLRGRRAIYCWMNPLLVSDPGRAHPDACYHQADCGAGNHVIISSHDIDLIYEIMMPYTYYAVQIPTHGAPGECFRVYGSDGTAITQPGLVKPLNWTAAV